MYSDGITLTPGELQNGVRPAKIVLILLHGQTRSMTE
jgi:hypothetical protein